MKPIEDCRVWLIDLDGTLYRPLPVKLLMAAQLLTAGPRVCRIIREFRHQHEALRTEQLSSNAGSTHDEPVPPGDPFQEQLRRTAARLSISLEAVRRVVDEWMFERPAHWLPLFRREELRRRIAAFRSNGGRTALVSDYPARRKLAALRMTDLFDVVIASGEADSPARLKPSPAGYLKAASLLNALPNECLVIGDRDDADGAAARDAGMAFVNVRNINGLRSEECETAAGSRQF